MKSLTAESIEHYVMQKAGVSKSFPFDEKTAVFKVGGKIFLLFDETKPELRFNVKCDPVYALELRTLYTWIEPGYHMNKKHWNTITVIEDVSEHFYFELIDHSYDLIFCSLTKKLQTVLKERT